MTPHPAPERRGITAAGNWIVDRVKTLDAFPGRGMLANILSETRSPGGAPANVLADLARLGAPFPLAGYGLVGDDADGRYLRETFAALGVDLRGLRATPDAGTSYTDVMTERDGGARTFFHSRGANRLFARAHVPAAELTCRIFHFGYLLLLDAFDAPTPDGRSTQAAALLADIRRTGIRACVDVVSEESDRFKKLVTPVLGAVDYLVLNEIETGRATGRAVRDAAGKLDGPALKDAVEELFAQGDMELIAVHLPEGFYLRERSGRRAARGSLRLPDGYVAGAVGAGDAFCAGMLYGLHEGWDPMEAGHLGSCCAAASLAAADASSGVRPLEETLNLGRRFGERPPPC